MMEKKVLDNIEKYEMIPKHSRILAGVSGGPDSLALLHLLHKIRSKLDFEMVVAHVDHMFRGEESYRDYIFVKNYCEHLDIPFEGTRVDVPLHMGITGESSQLAARNLRYAFFEEVMKKHNLSILALGHHGDDQIETMLMRITRGATGTARAGISAKRPFAAGHHIIRPFLVVSKDEIWEYAREHALVPRMDPSNDKDIYVRNRLRHAVLPALKKENPRVHEHFQRFSEELYEDEWLLQKLTLDKMKHIWVEKKDNACSIRIETLLSMPKSLQRRAIHLILNYLYTDRPASLSAVHIDELRALCMNPQPSAELHLPKGLIAKKSYELCTFQFFSEADCKYSLNVNIPGQTILSNGHMIIARYIKDEIPVMSGNHSFVISASKANLPFTARTRQIGDRIKIKGLDGSKKVKDIFINEKVPLTEREAWPVIIDQAGNVIWLPGLKKSNLDQMGKRSDVGEESFIYLEYKKA